MNARNVGLVAVLALTGTLSLGATITQAAVGSDEPVGVTDAVDHDVMHAQMMASMPEDLRTQCDAQHTLMREHHMPGDGAAPDHMGGANWGGTGMGSGHMGATSSGTAVGVDGHAAHHGDGAMGMNGVGQSGA